MANRPSPHGHNLPDARDLLPPWDDLPPGPGHAGPILEEDTFGQAPGERNPDVWRRCAIELPGGRGWYPATAKRQVRDAAGWWAWVETYQPTHRFLWVHASHLRPLPSPAAPDPLGEGLEGG